jgi:hypothetical protein
MDVQVKEIVEGVKPKTLPVPYTTKAKKNLQKQQKAFKRKTGGRISVKSLAGKLLETATLE